MRRNASIRAGSIVCLLELVPRAPFDCLAGSSCGPLAWIAIVLLLTHNPFPNRLYAAYPGMFIFSWLSWTWWKKNYNPDDWTFREAAMAVLASVAFAVARSGT